MNPPFDMINLELIAWYALGAAVVIGTTYLLTTWLTGLQARLKERSGFTRRLVAWLPVVQIGSWLAALALGIWVLSRAPTAVALALLVPAGVALVIGSRDFVQDAFAGAVLAFEHTILAGDNVHVAAPAGEIAGRIVAIGVRRTLLHTSDGAEIFLPNRTLMNSIVRTNREHELDSAVEIAMPEHVLDILPIEQLRKIALEAAYCSRYASLRKHPEFFIETDANGHEHASLLAHTFSPEFTRHLETEVLEMIHELSGQPSDAAGRA